jgi:hypothetical protein
VCDYAGAYIYADTCTYIQKYMHACIYAYVHIPSSSSHPSSFTSALIPCVSLTPSGDPTLPVLVPPSTATLNEGELKKEAAEGPPSRSATREDIVELPPAAAGRNSPSQLYREFKECLDSSKIDNKRGGCCQGRILYKI